MKSHMSPTMFRLLPVLALAAVTVAGNAATVIGSAAAAESTPAIKRIELFPTELTLSGARDVRRVLVTGYTAGNERIDLTSQAKWQSAQPLVKVDEGGFVSPVAEGATEVTVTASGMTAKLPVTVADVSTSPVSFVRDVMPIISKVGCNQGTCHGSKDGKAGFKLSLRGYDPLYDYRALIDDVSGRRFNRSRPDQSLMLLKPTQGVPHEGGFLFTEESRPYRIIEQWIVEGCRFDTAPKVSRLEIFPTKPLMQHRDETQQQIVLAHFEDGTVRDVSRDAIFETSNFEVAEVSATGEIRAVRRGEAAILVRYEGNYATNPVTVIGDREGFAWKDSPEFNYIDPLVNAKLKRMKILPSELCTDAEFLRRVSLDLAGVPPTPDQVEAFLKDPRPSREKREAKIDELLGSQGYIDHWTLKWSDLLLSNRKFIKEKGVWAFRRWIRHAIATNRPYDEFVYDLLTASGSTFENPAANYYRIAREPQEVMENMTQVFVGTRFSCAQCHDHPFERWTQQQYYQLSAYFAGVGRKKGVLGDDEIIYSLRTPGRITHPNTGENVPAAFPYDHAAMPAEDLELRHQLAEWLTARENAYFARSLVNRYWSYFNGPGIIDPVDDIRSSNPPSNPELLAALEQSFVESGFDMKKLIRDIVTSHTYQRSYQTNEWNEDDEINYSHALPRRLSAEQLYDAIMTATGAPERIPGVPAGFRATQLPDPKVNLEFLDLFGRPPRESPCECERSSDVSLRQTLNLINGPTIGDSIVHPEGHIAKMARQDLAPAAMIERVYLAALCRRPTDEESAQALQYFSSVGDKVEASQDLMWALINSPAFLFNR